jgi:hypothetical protein
MVLFFVIAMDVIKYAPGEKKAIVAERKARRHTRSHDYKI